MVNPGDFCTERIGGKFGARKDGEEKDVGIGKMLSIVGNEVLDTFRDLPGRISLNVIGADHQDDEFGIEAIDLAVLETPEGVFDPICANADIEGMAVGVIFFPDVEADAFPMISNGVAIEEEINAARHGFFLEMVLKIIEPCDRSDGHEGG